MSGAPEYPRVGLFIAVGLIAATGWIDWKVIQFAMNGDVQFYGWSAYFTGRGLAATVVGVAFLNLFALMILSNVVSNNLD